jgi:hypothetical protein
MNHIDHPLYFHIRRKDNPREIKNDHSYCCLIREPNIFIGYSVVNKKDSFLRKKGRHLAEQSFHRVKSAYDSGVQIALLLNICKLVKGSNNRIHDEVLKTIEAVAIKCLDAARAPRADFTIITQCSSYGTGCVKNHNLVSLLIEYVPKEERI